MIERLHAFALESLNDLDEPDNLDHKLWALEAYYLAQLAVTAAMVVAPQQIIYEGDMIRSHLFGKIKAQFREHISGLPGL